MMMLRLLPVSRLLALLPDPNCILYTSFVPNPLKALFSLLRQTMTRQLRSLTFPPLSDLSPIQLSTDKCYYWWTCPIRLLGKIGQCIWLRAWGGEDSLSLWQNGNLCQCLFLQFWTFFSRGRRVLCNLSEIRSECSQCHQLVILVRLHRKRD